MHLIKFPEQLRGLLENSKFSASIRAFADAAGEIYADNKLPFFPDYTDHGVDHINHVLRWEVDLVPNEVWEWQDVHMGKKLLTDADAVIIIGATILHDIAMHIREAGFLMLIHKESIFKPVPWFDKEQKVGNAKDLPWNELWEEYVREARMFSDQQLSDIIGEEEVRTWRFEHLPAKTGQWEKNHYLIVGEFLRRHHARLAHEIAKYGFPGLDAGSEEGQFPALYMDKQLSDLADLIGLTARSHGTSLRHCKYYLEFKYGAERTSRVMGAAVYYAMALLRIADYLQIEHQRAPIALLNLRHPQSPVSVKKWAEHKVVMEMPLTNDGRGIRVRIADNLDLTIYLQLEELLAGLQEELDQSTAVLDEVYGGRKGGLDKLSLALRHVESNLHDPAFCDNLPFVPRRIGFSADPHLLTLLIEPLYGKESAVGVRELMQNSVDAVRELVVWSQNHGRPLSTLDLPNQEPDVQIRFLKQQDGSWLLRATDRGIGMSVDTIANYFLRGGASFRNNPMWRTEFLDEQGQPSITRSGRFGIGVFAIFLLGRSFRLETRHAGADRSMGYRLNASIDSQLIEIEKAWDLPIGTTIEVLLNPESAKSLRLDIDRLSKNDAHFVSNYWFCFDWPKVQLSLQDGDRIVILKQRVHVPFQTKGLPPEWFVIYPPGFNAVFWSFKNPPGRNWRPDIIINGFSIIGLRDIGSHYVDPRYYWPADLNLSAPMLNIIDNEGNTNLAIDRYKLSNPVLPFIEQLGRDVVLSFIAHALVCGPTSLTDVITGEGSYPLSGDNYLKYIYQDADTYETLSQGYLQWCATKTAMVPADPALFQSLQVGTCIMFGILGHSVYLQGDYTEEHHPLTNYDSTGSAVLCWNVSYGREHPPYENYYYINSEENDPEQSNGKAPEGGEYPPSQVQADTGIEFPVDFLTQLLQSRVPILGNEVEAVHILVAANGSFDFDLFDDLWKQKNSIGYKRRVFEAYHDDDSYHKPLEIVFENLVTATDRNMIEEGNFTEYKYEGEPAAQTVAYVSRFKVKSTDHAPETFLARIWFECLGNSVIPFDPAARAALIEKGCLHPELKRHIDAWQELQRTSSDWCTEGRRQGGGIRYNL